MPPDGGREEKQIDRADDPDHLDGLALLSRALVWNNLNDSCQWQYLRLNRQYSKATLRSVGLLSHKPRVANQNC